MAVKRISDYTAASTPLAGTEQVEVETAGGASRKTTVQDIADLSAGGTVATDTIWDAIGDLVVGTGANTAARLAKGSAGQELIVGASTLEYANRALVHVATATVSGSAATSLSLSSLSMSTDECYLIVGAFENATGSSSSVRLFYNADTTATNFNREALSGSGSSASASNASDAFLFNLDASSVTNIFVLIFNDRDSKPRALCLSNRGEFGSVIVQFVAHMWTTAANVTDIVFSGSVASSLAVGSYFKLFRLKP